MGNEGPCQGVVALVVIHPTVHTAGDPVGDIACARVLCVSGYMFFSVLTCSLCVCEIFMLIGAHRGEIQKAVDWFPDESLSL